MGDGWLGGWLMDGWMARRMNDGGMDDGQNGWMDGQMDG